MPKMRTNEYVSLESTCTKVGTTVGAAAGGTGAVCGTGAGAATGAALCSVPGSERRLVR